MPFCTECGAKHAENAAVCPNCGEAIGGAPPDDDFDTLVDALGEGVELDDELPDAGSADAESAGPDYMEEIDQIRSLISAQTTALERLSDPSWSDPAAVAIRDQLDEALERLQLLQPPAALGGGHDDFVEGTRLLAAGFSSLVDARDAREEDAIVEAQATIGEATERFLRGADLLNEYFTLKEAGLSDEDILASLVTPEPSPSGPSSVASAPGPMSATEDAGDDGEDQDDDEDEDEDDFDLDAVLSELAPHLPVAEDLPELPSSPASFAPGIPRIPPTHVPAAPPAFSSIDFGLDAQAGAWPQLGDPATDSLLLEIESGWVKSRPQIHDNIERAVRSAVADALRASLGTRLRMEQEARTVLDRVGSERNRLVDEVESLRREAHGLQSELAELRRALNELERERQVAQDRRQQMFADAESHRAQLLREIEQLGGQLDAMRQNIVSLLNMSLISGTPGDAPATDAAPEPPPVPPTEAAAVPDKPSATEIRISAIASLAKNLQLQQALKALPGITIEGQPRYRSGVLTATLRHDPDVDLASILTALPNQPLSLGDAAEPGVIELIAT